MQVTDDIEATVRAYLRGDTPEYNQRFAAMDRSRDNVAAFRAMVIAAFLLTVQYKFSKDTPQDDIIDYVAGIRSRADSLANDIDPTTAERMITSVFTGENTSDIEAGKEVEIQMLFATAIVNDEGIEDELFEQLMSSTRKLANDLLS